LSETIAANGRRYLTEGRLTITKVDGDQIAATCKGDSGSIYTLGFDPSRADWYCDCPARGRCRHLTALMLVVVRQAQATEGAA
jgi:uncharacterized Zn finger protein